MGTQLTAHAKEQQMLSKVPEITVFFWIIKVLCTTVGETASDFLNVNLGFGLTGTSIVMGGLLIVIMFFQFRAKKYVPVIYWLTVVLISIFGTLVTDNMTDAMGIPLELSTIVFSCALALTFIVWYASEKTLSMHSIFTARREAFYWLTILFTFALGTAAGDLMAESLGLGYLTTGIIVCAVIVAVSVSWKLGLDSVLGFWLVYIMTRPLGASLGDYLSQPVKYGGLGLGATITSVIFISAIMLTVIFLSVSKIDLEPKATAKENTGNKRFAALKQVVAVVCVLVIASGAGYYWRHNALLSKAQTSIAQAPSQGNSPSSVADAAGKGASSSSHVSALGDLSSFTTIEQDTLSSVNAGNMSAAKSSVADLEYTWDNAEAHLKPMDPAKWTAIDKTIDSVLRDVRAVNPDAAACKSSLEASLTTLGG